MAFPAGVGSTDRLLSRTRFLFLSEAAFQVEVIGALARPPWPPSLSVKFARRISSCLAPEAVVMARKGNVVVQHAFAVFKHGELSLTWECPFCGDHNEWSYSNVPPLVLFPSPIPSFCHGCRKGYAIKIRQKFTGVVRPEMN